MNSISTFTYLNQRQYGHDYGLRKKMRDKFIEQLRYIPKTNNLEDHMGTADILMYPCKFSRHLNNLHVLGCSSEYGEIVIQNTINHFDLSQEQYKLNQVHEDFINDFAWAESQLKLVTVCNDGSSKLCNVYPSGNIITEKTFMSTSGGFSVSFCPGSSDIFCGGYSDGSVKIWDGRINNAKMVLYHRSLNDNDITDISCVLFQNDQTILSCSFLNREIKLWDLRKSYNHVGPLTLIKYTNNTEFAGYRNIILDRQSSYMYASGTNDVIYCFLLDSTAKEHLTPIRQYSGHYTPHYSNISVTNDGRYLFSGCLNEAGVLWCTDYPYIDKPVYSVFNATCNCMISSDWCADPACLKLVVCDETKPMIFTILPLEQQDPSELTFCKTTNHQRLFWKKK